MKTIDLRARRNCVVPPLFSWTVMKEQWTQGKKKKLKKNYSIFGKTTKNTRTCCFERKQQNVEFLILGPNDMGTSQMGGICKPASQT